MLCRVNYELPPIQIQTSSKLIETTRKSKLITSRRSSRRINDTIGFRLSPFNFVHSCTIKVKYSVGCSVIHSTEVSMSGGWPNRHFLLNRQTPSSHLLKPRTWWHLQIGTRLSLHSHFPPEIHKGQTISLQLTLRKRFLWKSTSPEVVCFRFLNSIWMEKKWKGRNQNITTNNYSVIYVSQW